MAKLSEKLRGVVSQAKQAADQQYAAGTASNVYQTQQALTQATTQPQVLDATQVAQQLAPAITQAQADVALKAQAQAGTQALEAGQRALGEEEQRTRLRLESQRQITEREISDLQREGKLRQNSLELEQSKRLQARELKDQQRMQQTGLVFDNRISFLTRKQREDLAGIGRLAKQQVFDSRLQFKIEEGKRKFSNDRQLADYAVLSAENEIELQKRLRVMEQAFTRSIQTMEIAQVKIQQRMTQEFQKAEQDKNQALALELAQAKKALEEKIRRKKARAAATKAIIKGVIVTGAIAATIATAGAAAPAAAGAAGAAGAGGAAAAGGGASAASILAASGIASAAGDIISSQVGD